MAIESLARFLEDQLAKLPEANSERSFLEKINRQVQSHLGLVEYSSPKQKGGFLSSGDHIVEYFKTARRGPYLQVDEVTNLLDQPHLTWNYRSYGQRLVHTVAQHGGEAIAHLCIPARAWNPLARSNIGTITEVRERISDGTLVELRSFSNQQLMVVVSSLAEFDREITKVENPS